MLEALIERIYEAAGTPKLWPDVLRCVGDYATSDRGVLKVIPSSGPSRWIASPTLEGPPTLPFSQIPVEDGGIKARWGPRAHTGFVRDSDEIFVSGNQDTHRLDKPCWRVGTIIQLPTGDVAVVAAERRADRGPHEAEIVPKLDAVRPHLVRACQLGAQFGSERARLTTAALNQIGLSAAVLTASGQILAANALLQERAGARPLAQDDCAALKTLINSKLLQDAINTITNGNCFVQSIPVRMNPCDRALIAHVFRFDKHPGDVFDASAVLLILGQVGAPAAPDNGLLNLLFDLTPAEAKLLRALAGGLRLQSYAESVGVRTSTVRSQLASIFDKTGTSRQAELLSIIASISMFSSHAKHC